LFKETQKEQLQKSHNPRKSNYEIVVTPRETEITNNSLTRHLYLEESVARQVRMGRNLNTVGKYATAMSMGITYQSMCHTDKDFYYSLLTVAAPSH